MTFSNCTLDESFPPLPPPMPTLDELRKKQSSTSWRLPSSMPASIEPPSFQSKRNTTPEKDELDDFGPPRPPPRKRSRKLRLASSFFDDSNTEQLHNPEPMSSYPASSKPPSSEPENENTTLERHEHDDTSAEQPIRHNHSNSLPFHETSICEPGVTSSTPESVGGFFPEFFQILSHKTGHPQYLVTSHPLNLHPAGSHFPSPCSASPFFSSSILHAPIFPAYVQQADLLVGYQSL